jgi:PAS domain S-box-containing protein
LSSDYPVLAIPPEVLRTWQRIVDLLAGIMHVPSAVVTMLEPPDYTHYRILASSTSEGNPFPVDDIFAMDIGTFCETVINTREPLLVADALGDQQWQSAPELRVGMVSYLGFPVLWPDGRIFGTICVLDDKANGYSDLYREVLQHCRDVLEGDLQALARLGSALEEERANLSELLTRVPAAVVMVARDSRITRINPAFTAIFGFTAEEALGRRIKELITPDDLQEELDGFLDRMVRTGDVFTAETVRRHKDGTRVPVALTCVPVSSDAGGTTGYVIYRDITESKRLQDEQRRYHEMQLELAHANRIATIGQLSASIAHELTQPLTGITTNCSTCLRMLAGDSPNLEGARTAVQRTMRDASRASEVLTRLRALFGKREAVAEEMDLNEAIQEVVALSLGELRKGCVTVRTELADDLPPVTGDRVQLQQVILNLLLNALEAMRDVEGRPRDLVISTERQEGGRAGVSVRDSGRGFDPHAVDRLFEAFYTTKPDGMGMGLSVSRSIIESHHGRLWAAPNSGPGATFAFSVPGGGDTSVQ